jgi:hypothetical protein
MHLLKLLENFCGLFELVLKTDCSEKIHRFTIFFELSFKKFKSIHFSPREIIILFYKIGRFTLIQFLKEIKLSQ